MTLGERIKKIRSDAGLTQKEFGECIGVGRLYVSSLEIGQAQPGKARLFVIADKFNVNLEWLQAGNGEPYLSDEFKRERAERDYIVRLFTSLPVEMQKQIIDALREIVGTSPQNVVNNNGTINGNINQGNKQ